jgi:hypothetical protein
MCVCVRVCVSDKQRGFQATKKKKRKAYNVGSPEGFRLIAQASEEAKG